MNTPKKNNLILIVLVICVIFYIIYKYIYVIKNYFNPNLQALPESGEPINKKGRNIGLVVARYNEDVNWLIDMVPFYMKNKLYPKTNLYLYLKSNEPLNIDISLLEKYYNRVYIEKLKNVGMGLQSYFYHIVKNYDKLEDVTYFIPGSSNNIIKKNLLRNLLENGLNYEYYFTFVNNDDSLYNFTIDEYIVTEEKNQTKENSNFKISTIRPFGKWYAEYTNKELSTTKVNYKDMFSLSSTIIRKLPISFYETINNLLCGCVNSEDAHYVERMWYPLFSSL